MELCLNFITSACCIEIVAQGRYHKVEGELQHIKSHPVFQCMFGIQFAAQTNILNTVRSPDWISVHISGFLELE